MGGNDHVRLGGEVPEEVPGLSPLADRTAAELLLARESLRVYLRPLEDRRWEGHLPTLELRVQGATVPDVLEELAGAIRRKALEHVGELLRAGAAAGLAPPDAGP
jgi:hypothetical protein